MIDRFKLERGSLADQIRQVYALTEDDFLRDPSIIHVLRSNLRSEDRELLEISIMRLGIRAKDDESRHELLKILTVSSHSIVRSAAIAALSSIYRRILEMHKSDAQFMLDEILNIDLSDDDRRQVFRDFRL